LSKKTGSFICAVNVNKSQQMNDLRTVISDFAPVIYYADTVECAEFCVTLL